MTAPDHRGTTAPPARWAWTAFALAAVWVVVVRMPIVLNAADHLDSDLAVDGLTLLEATRGHWRWHYPGTPFMGTGAVLLSLPQALFWGANPVTLVSGGTVAYLGLLAAAFWLAWRAAGPAVAAWSLAPLAFASTGAIWLSARITGGHLLAAAWHAGAFALLADALKRGGKARALGLGTWCGFGLYLDSMTSVTTAGLVTAASLGWLARGMPRRAIVPALAFVLGFVAGAWPRPVGMLRDPHDAYRDQFTFSLQPAVLASHARLMGTDCLPRLIAGHRLPGLESEPDPASLSGVDSSEDRGPSPGLALAVVGLTTSLAAASVLALAAKVVFGPSAAARVVCGGLILSVAATLVGFVANRNIFNSDNYRYLVGLLVPLSLGFGVMADLVFRKGWGGRVVAAAAVAALGALMTADSVRWYARFGWVDGASRPVRRPVDDPTLAWLRGHPEVTWVEGSYWDVYRLVFLSGVRVKGAPFPIYPDRFPEWRAGPARNRVVVIRPSPEGVAFGEEAVRKGYRPVNRARGLTILQRP